MSVCRREYVTASARTCHSEAFGAFAVVWRDCSDEFAAGNMLGGMCGGPRDRGDAAPLGPQCFILIGDFKASQCMLKTVLVKKGSSKAGMPKYGSAKDSLLTVQDIKDSSEMDFRLVFGLFLARTVLWKSCLCFNMYVVLASGSGWL